MGVIAALCGFLREAPRPNLASRQANLSGTISCRSMMYNAAPGSTHPKPSCLCAIFQALMLKTQDIVRPLLVSVVQPTFRTSLHLPQPARSAMQNLLRHSEHQYGRILCMRGPILMWGRGSASHRRAGGGVRSSPATTVTFFVPDEPLAPFFQFPRPASEGHQDRYIEHIPA